jgi:hypothetical protein
MKKTKQISQEKRALKAFHQLAGNFVTVQLPVVKMPKGVKRTMKYGKEIHNPWNKKSVFCWCLHCERTYRRGECREINGLQMCPYEGCNGDTFGDAWPWEKIRGEHNYPVIPTPGEVYPMYPAKPKRKGGKK